MLKECYRCGDFYKEDASPSITVHEQTSQHMREVRNLCPTCRLNLSGWLRKKEDAPLFANASTLTTTTSYHEAHHSATKGEPT